MVLLFISAARPASAQCTLSGTVATWTDGSGEWNTASNWTPTGVPNSSATDVCITDGTSSVSLDTAPASVGNLQLASGNTLNASAPLTVNGSQILNNGQIILSGPYGFSAGSLDIGGTTNLQGPGTVTLAGGTINGVTQQGNCCSSILTNESTIQGTGIIGLVGFASLVNTGTINANVAGQNLTISFTPLTNSGTLEATNGGIVTLFPGPTINNENGTVAAIGVGSNIYLGNGTDIQGGTLTTAAGGSFSNGGETILDGSTHGALTLSTGTTFTAPAAGVNVTQVLGTIVNNGNMQFNSGAILQIGGNTTLQGTGTVTLGGGSLGVSGGSYTLTNESTIQGMGGSTNSPNIINAAGGTIDANVSGQVLSFPLATIANTGGTLEATNGGILELDYTHEINNENGVIAAIGPGSLVTFNSGSRIDGGTLTTSSGGTMGPLGADFGIFLDGSTHGPLTISAGSTWTSTGTSTTVLGTIINNGNMLFGGGSFLQPSMTIGGDTVLQGTGTVTLSPNNDGLANIGPFAGSYTLTNQSTIQGAGVISGSYNSGPSVSALALINQGLIDANVSGQTLTLSPTSLQNSGTLQVESGGTMLLSTSSGVVTNTGSINVNSGGTLNNTVILNNTLGASLNNDGTLNNTGGTIYNDSASTINNTGTINNTLGASLNNAGTLNNTGGILYFDSTSTLTNGGTVQGFGTISVLNFVNNGTVNANGLVPLTINGSLSNNLSGVVNVTGLGGLAVNGGIQNHGLINVNNSNLVVTGGYGDVGGGTLQLQNGSTGTITGGVSSVDAPGRYIIVNNSSLNVVGTFGDASTIVTQGTLKIQGNVEQPDGAVLDLQRGSAAVVTGSFGGYGQRTLIDSSGLVVGSNYRGDHFSITTLSNGGILSVNGGISVGVASAFNMSGGSLATANGDFLNYNSSVSINNSTLKVTGTFTNEQYGRVSVGPAGILTTTNYSQLNDQSLSLIDVSGTLVVANSYQQGAGATTIESGGLIRAGSFLATGGTVTVNGILDPTAVEFGSGATLQGTGTIFGNVAMGGTLLPGTSGTPGTLTIVGNYEQLSTGMLQELVGPLSQSFLNVTGDVALDANSSLDIILLNGYDPLGQTFSIMDYNSLVGQFSNGSSFWQDGFLWDVNYGPHEIDVTAVATPEPSSFLLLGAGLLLLAGFAARKYPVPPKRAC